MLPNTSQPWNAGPIDMLTGFGSRSLRFDSSTISNYDEFFDASDSLQDAYTPISSLRQSSSPSGHYVSTRTSPALSNGDRFYDSFDATHSKLKTTAQDNLNEKVSVLLTYSKYLNLRRGFMFYLLLFFRNSH